MLKIRYATYKDRCYWDRAHWVPEGDVFDIMVDDRRGYICERDGKVVALLNFNSFMRYAIIENYVYLVEDFLADEHEQFLNGCCNDMANRGLLVAVLCYDKNNRYHNNVFACGFERHGFIPDLWHLIGPDEEIRVKKLWR